MTPVHPILEKAIAHFGEENQIAKAIEEMAELTAELARRLNNRAMNINIISEIADVFIMMEQMKYIFGNDLVDQHIAIKIRRLELLIEECQK